MASKKKVPAKAAGVAVQTRLPAATFNHLQGCADAEGRSIANLLRKLVDNYLARKPT